MPINSGSKEWMAFEPSGPLWGGSAVTSTLFAVERLNTLRFAGANCPTCDRWPKGLACEDDASLTLGHI